MSAPVDDSGTSSAGLAQAWAWIVCGRRLVRQQQSLWYGMAAVYFALAFLLKLIPLGGTLLLILLTPMLLAGVLWGQELVRGAEPRPAAPNSSTAALFQAWVARPAQELLRIFSHEEKVYPAVLLGIVTLGLAIFVLIPRDWFVGGSMVSGLAASGSGVPYLMILKIAVVVVLYVLLAMGLLFSVPLTVIGERLPLASIGESFSACRAHTLPLLALVAPFFLVYLIIVLAFAKAHWLGYLLTLSAGLLALPLFVASIYCSYLALFINPSDQQR